MDNTQDDTMEFIHLMAFVTCHYKLMDILV